MTAPATIDPADRRIQSAFEVGVVLKAFGALIECASGLALYLVSIAWLTGLATAVAGHELIGHPDDRIANVLMNWAANFHAGGKTFAGLYLFSHGLVKLVLMLALLRNLKWAFPASLAVMSLFVAYQVYRMTFAVSIGLVLLTLFDLVVIALIWREYRMIRGRVAAAEPLGT